MRAACASFPAAMHLSAAERLPTLHLGPMCTLKPSIRQTLTRPALQRTLRSHTTRLPHSTTRALFQQGGGADDEVSRIVAKYGGGPLRPTGPPSSSSTQQPRSMPQASGMGNGIFTILVLNFGLFLATQFWAPQLTSVLCLDHWRPHWWQFATATFMHYNWEHLISNAFSLLVFGRMVEEEEGVFGVWATYLICGASGCLASYISASHTHTLSLGASSAVFGLFVVGVLTKLRPSVKRLLEALILGSFVVNQVLQEVSLVSSGKVLSLGGASVGHWAHLGGAAAGVLLVVALSRLPTVGDA